MREIVLDTETTGFEPSEGDRIVEIGAIELMGHVPTGRTYHQYINPQRSMPAAAFGVHGIGPDLLEPPQQPQPGRFHRAAPARRKTCAADWHNNRGHSGGT